MDLAPGQLRRERLGRFALLGRQHGLAGPGLGPAGRVQFLHQTAQQSRRIDAERMRRLLAEADTGVRVDVTHDVRIALILVHGWNVALVDAGPDLTLPGPSGSAVPLSQLATARPELEEPVLWRRSRETVLTVRADIQDGLQPVDVTGQVLPLLDPIRRDLPPGYRIDTGGAVEESAKANDSLFALFPVMGLVMWTLVMVQTQSFKKAGLVFAIALGIRSLNESAHTRAFVNIRPLLGSMPLPATEWGVDALFAEAVLTEIERRSPGLVVECGSGISTLLFGSCLEALGTGSLITFEHDEEFASQAISLARSCGCADRLQLVVNPLGRHRVADRDVSWYVGLEALEGRDPIEILIVDGPPAATGPFARYPAVPLLLPYLAPNAAVFLHDGSRSDETETALRWGAEVGSDPVYVDCPPGGWLVRVPEGPTAVRG